MKLRWMVAALAAVTVVAAVSASFGLAYAMKAHGARSAPPSASRTEQIQVHGQWRLEVRNPDGTTVRVVTFHNDPTQAAQAIATILARAYTPGYWWVQLGSTTGNGPACVASGTPVGCRIIDPNDNGAFASSPNSFKTLTTSSSGVQSSITLNGSMTAQRDGDVNTVDSNLSVCATSVAPNATCGTSSFWPFTSRTLGSPVSLVTGQQLLVTVTLSFS